MVSVKRLTTFFKADELQSDARNIVVKHNLQEGDEASDVLYQICIYFSDPNGALQVLSIVDGDFSWSQTAQTPALQDINISVKKGELVAVLGRVGAGKVHSTQLRCYKYDAYLLLT
jgi:ATP-binding cassette, subfamily C (CFTR/MRP), member 1